uniref:NmrA family protein n=1 Tax=Cyanothece sp. (strain PCC 7425 / ATCC 29141) TaxID=395961 RepID=B8HN78_CYAP4
MNLLIVGATGTLGRQIARRALDQGHEVHCLVRNPRNAPFLKEWGANLIPGDLCDPTSLAEALTGMTAVIDAATTRATDSLSIKQVDWQGKVNLIQAAQSSGIEHFVFFSIMDAHKYPDVPLMEIKKCTEGFLAESGLNYTILRPCGFYQGLIGQYAIPILERQSVWVMGEASPIAYMDTQDIARFAVEAIARAEVRNQSFDLAGPKAWGPYEIIRLCERLSDREAKVSRMPVGLLRNVRRLASWFEWGWNVADRLAFTEVIASGTPLDAPMAATYSAFGFDPDQTLTLEAYLQDYFSRILQKLKEINYEKNKSASRKRSPFKSSQPS